MNINNWQDKRMVANFHQRSGFREQNCSPNYIKYRKDLWVVCNLSTTGLTYPPMNPAHWTNLNWTKILQVWRKSVWKHDGSKGRSVCSYRTDVTDCFWECKWWHNMLFVYHSNSSAMMIWGAYLLQLLKYFINATSFFATFHSLFFSIHLRRA